MMPTLLVEAASPPLGSPPAPPEGGWVDITNSVLLASPLRITRGRQDERAVASSATCTLTLSNADGWFTEGAVRTIPGDHPGTETTLRWQRWTWLRVAINGQLRFTGRLTDLGQSWPGAVESSAVVTVTASGAKAILARSPNLKSWLPELYEELYPIAWWPLDDPEGSLSGHRDGVPYPPMSIDVFRGGDMITSDSLPFAFGGSAPAWFDGAGGGLTLSPKFEVGDDGLVESMSVACPFVVGAPIDGGGGLLGGGTLLFVHRPNFGADHHGPVPIASIMYANGSCLALFRIAGALQLSFYLPGDSGSGPGSTVVAGGVVEDGVPRLIGISAYGATARVLGVPGSAFLATTDPAIIGLCNLRQTSPATSEVGGTPIPRSVASGFYSEVAWIPGAPMSDADFATLRRRVEGGMGSDLEWLQRACSYAGTATPVKLGPGRQIRRPTLRGSNPAAIGDWLADAQGGVFAELRDGTPALVDARYCPAQASVPTIHLDMCDADALRWGSDPGLYVTEAGRGEVTLASRPGFPRARVDVEDGLSDDAAQRLAWWLVNSSDVAAAPRLTGIRLDLLAMASTAAYEPLAWLPRPRVRIDVSSLPSQLPAAMRTMTVEGTTETVSVTEWTLDLSTAPDPRFILADPVQGVLGVPADNRLGF